MIKKGKLIAVLFLVALSLVGCAMTAGIALEVTPNPIILTSANDVIEATVTASTTGFGELRIDGFSGIVKGVKDGEEIILFTINSADLGFEPIATPIAVEGFSEEFDLQELLCKQFNDDEFTVQDLIDLVPTEDGITSYDDIKIMDSVTLTFSIEGSQNVTEEVSFIFE